MADSMSSQGFRGRQLGGHQLYVVEKLAETSQIDE